MSVTRYQMDNKILPTPTQIEFLEREHQGGKPYCVKYFNRSKNTKSLQSIQIKGGSVLMISKNQSQNRRKLFSIEKSEVCDLHTHRPQSSAQSAKKIIFQSYFKRLNRPERVKTIEDESLYFKEKKIKDCIQLMQGVLEEIQNQKCQKKQANFRSNIMGGKSQQITTNKSSSNGQMSKFESYIRNVCNIKQEKMIVLRKAKAKSVVNNESIKSAAILNAQRFETIRQDRPRQIEPFHPSSSLRKGKQKLYFQSRQKQDGKLQELDFSSIDCVNQSSFISQLGKKSLIKHLQEQNIQQKQGSEGNKLVNKLKHHRKLKNVFPDGFF